MKTTAAIMLFVCAVLTAGAARAQDVSAEDGGAVPATETKIYVGVGAGFEAGNGIRLGLSRGRHGLETGFGPYYSGETGVFRYSFGGRYLYTLYEGAYTWIGGGRMGHRNRSDRAHLTSGGAGLGVSWQLGPMFRLMVDSGWRIYSDSEVNDGDMQINPTFNGALVYIW